MLGLLFDKVARRKNSVRMSASLVGGSTVPDHGGRLLVSFDLVNRTALS